MVRVRWWRDDKGEWVRGGGEQVEKGSDLGVVGYGRGVGVNGWVRVSRYERGGLGYVWKGVSGCERQHMGVEGWAWAAGHGAGLGVEGRAGRAGWAACGWVLVAVGQ